jgi:acyl-lipid omega-6 desaturase (Delta-12 desaturase)
MTNPTAVAPTNENDWRRLLAPYKKASWGRALFQLANTLIPFVLLWAAMAIGVARSQYLVLLLVIPTAFFFIRLFILQHDCGHGAFFPSRAANNALGSVLGVITMFPYGYWRRTHSIHHATTGNLDQREFGDVRTLTVREYQARTPFGRFLYRLYRHPFVLFGVGPTYQFVLKHRLPIDIPWSWKREWKSVITTNIAIGATLYGLASVFGWGTVALVWMPVVMVAGAIGVWLFYVQHQFEETYWQSGDSWDFYRASAEGSSFYDLHPVLHWLTGNIGFHHIHHLSSQIPNYRLAECFRENPSLQNVTRLTLRQSLRCAGLKLWDEEQRTMVRFRDLAQTAEQGVPAVG